MKTRVILRADIASLGHVGEAVEVSAGFARNHLFPLGMAYPYSADALQRVEKDRKVADLRRVEEMKEHVAIAARLAEVQLTFEEKVSEEGHLYGSVSSHRIAEALQEQGLTISDRQIRLPEPLREIGEFEVTVHVFGELEAPIKVWVVAAAEAPAEG
ncbi:MAG: 50S ribosomal protein L9 [Planctomycetes bacterium]|nr:50S ribosomal protein L9 [Planctomycetota bacterium]MBL7007635.1 50S ribosomal protein L9 [Planctomycetota bacterium]